MGDNFTFSDPDSSLIRATGELADPGATPGDVLTVQSDGSIAAESGGSLPAQWTVTANGDLLITPTDASGIGLEVLKGLEADGANLLRLKATDALAGLDVNGDGSFLSYHGPDTIGFSVRTGAGTEIIFADPVAQTLGFFNHAPASRPVVPLTTPSVQNVIDALVALGLIVQHD